MKSWKFLDKLRLWCLQTYTAVHARVYEFISVILVSAGINLLTQLPEPPQAYWMLLGGLALLASGASLFFSANRVQEIYDAARVLSKDEKYETVPLNELAYGVLLRRGGATEGRWVDVKAVSLAVLFVAVGAIAIGVSHCAKPSKVIQPVQPVPRKGISVEQEPQRRKQTKPTAPEVPAGEKRTETR